MGRTHEAHRCEGKAGVVRRGVWVGVFIAACSGGSDHPKTIGTSGTGGTAGATGVGGNAGSRGIGGTSRDGGDGDSGTTVGAPVVNVTSPLPLTEPTAGPVVVGDTVIVLCTATRASNVGA